MAELRREVIEMESRLEQLRAGSGLYSWAYFEKLIGLQNQDIDRSEALSVSEPGLPQSGEIRIESLLDTLVWATHKFGNVSQALTRICEASERIGEAWDLRWRGNSRLC